MLVKKFLFGKLSSGSSFASAKLQSVLTSGAAPSNADCTLWDFFLSAPSSRLVDCRVVMVVAYA